jgi:DNA-binding PadR family transcriptional regulator
MSAIYAASPGGRPDVRDLYGRSDRLLIDYFPDPVIISFNDISYDDIRLPMDNANLNLPLSEQTYFILLSLRSGPKHGYAIMKDVHSLSGGRLALSVSTLYTTLKRLLDDGWIRFSPAQPLSNRPRKTYELSGLGGDVLRDEIRRLETLISAARAGKAIGAR